MPRNSVRLFTDLPAAFPTRTANRPGSEVSVSDTDSRLRQRALTQKKKVKQNEVQREAKKHEAEGKRFLRLRGRGRGDAVQAVQCLHIAAERHCSLLQPIYLTFKRRYSQIRIVTRNVT